MEARTTGRWDGADGFGGEELAREDAEGAVLGVGEDPADLVAEDCQRPLFLLLGNFVPEVLQRLVKRALPRNDALS